jgi:hypothetical protein
VRLVGDRYLIYFTVVNIFHTRPTIRKGFTFKEFKVFGCILGKWFRISIPFWIVSYNRKKAEDLERFTQAIMIREMAAAFLGKEEKLDEKK